MPRFPRRLAVAGLFGLASCGGFASMVLAAGTMTQTIVFLRHGEKPAAIFAPDPSKRKEDAGTSYDYVRPLATIEPTAIALGLPVDTSFGYDDIGGLEAALKKPDYRGKLIFVAWEHKQIVDLARELMRDNGGDAKAVPKWHGKDFDSLYVLHITRDGSKPSVTFEKFAEGLDGQPDTCPQPAK